MVKSWDWFARPGFEAGNLLAEQVFIGSVVVFPNGLEFFWLEAVVCCALPLIGDKNAGVVKEMSSSFRNEVLGQLPDEDFKFLVRSAPLASVDICVLVSEKLLLGKREREPLRDKWFTPGGCVRKGERWQDAVVRVSRSELGLHINPYDLVGMGSWDQFYDHSVCGDKVPTHYVTRAHALFLIEYPDINLDEQHSEFRWVSLAEISSGAEFSVYLKDYVEWFESRKASRGFSSKK